jgi:predicted nucleic acid-binding protein
VVNTFILIAFFLREEGWNEFAKHMVRTVSLDHAVKEFYNAVWKAVSIKRELIVEKR